MCSLADLPKGAYAWQCCIFAYPCAHQNADPSFKRVRLSGLNSSSQGRFEFNIDGYWAGLQASYLYTGRYSNSTLRAWLVDKVCQELGFMRGEAFTGTFVGITQAQWDYANCTGTEKSITDCTWPALPGTKTTVDAIISCSYTITGVAQVPSFQVVRSLPANGLQMLLHAVLVVKSLAATQFRDLASPLLQAASVCPQH